MKSDYRVQVYGKLHIFLHIETCKVTFIIIIARMIRCHYGNRFREFLYLKIQFCASFDGEILASVLEESGMRCRISVCPDRMPQFTFPLCLIIAQNILPENTRFFKHGADYGQSTQPQARPPNADCYDKAVQKLVSKDNS